MICLVRAQGVAVVTAGPGLTNTITAVKNAQMAQSPVVVFAGATAIILKGRVRHPCLSVCSCAVRDACRGLLCLRAHTPRSLFAPSRVCHPFGTSAGLMASLVYLCRARCRTLISSR